MKMKLLLFLGFLIGSVGFSLFFIPQAYAIGETYKWINETTIQGSGGSFGGSIVKTGDAGPSRPVPAGTVLFTRDGNTKVFKAPTDLYTGSAGGSSGTTFSTKCDLQLAITVTALNGGSITTNDSGTRTCSNTGLTPALTIGDTDKGPSPESLGVGAAVTTGPGADLSASTEEESVSSCKVDGIGWIICPVVRTMASIVDGAYTFVSSLLVVQPLMADGGAADSSIYGAWSVMRNFANIAFVIVFMIIIFSQLTSVGLNNYGIKKMLPRLIVAAILVNASFWICAIAVDISNILGASLNGILKGLPVADTTNGTQFKYDGGQTGIGWEGIAGGVLATTAIAAGVLYATLSALLPALLAAIIAIATVFIVLTVRQALIILLVVISPLAFVAYLLPNTESLFKKWLSLFKTLLLMYPIIAVIFGASALASEIVMTSAKGDYAVAIQIMGALIAVIPLALTPIIMKTAGGFLNRIGGVINNPNKGPVDKLRKRAEGFRDRRQAIAGSRRMERGQLALNKTSGLRSRIRGDGSSKLRNRTATMLGSVAAGVSSSGATGGYDAQQKNEYAKRAQTESQQDYVANRASTDAQYAQNLAGPSGNATKIQASAVAAMRGRMQSEIKDASEIIQNLNLDQVQTRELALGNKIRDSAGKVIADPADNIALRNAARQEVINNGDANGVKALMDQSVTMNQEDRLGLAAAFQASNNRPAFVSQGYLANMRQGTHGNHTQAIEAAIENNTYSADKIAVTDKDEINMVARVAVTSTAVSTASKQRLVDNAHTALTDPELSVKISKNLDDITDLRNHVAPRRTP